MSEDFIIRGVSLGESRVTGSMQLAFKVECPDGEMRYQNYDLETDKGLDMAGKRLYFMLRDQVVEGELVENGKYTNVRINDLVGRKVEPLNTGPVAKSGAKKKWGKKAEVEAPDEDLPF